MKFRIAMQETLEPRTPTSIAWSLMLKKVLRCVKKSRLGLKIERQRCSLRDPRCYFIVALVLDS